MKRDPAQLLARAIVGELLNDPAMAAALGKAVAPAIVDELERHQRPLVDAHEIARLTGLTAATVRRRAKEFGGVPVGDGPRPRLMFDPERAIRAHRIASARMGVRGASASSTGQPHPPPPGDDD